MSQKNTTKTKAPYKMGPKKQKKFLKALGETGNITLSAELVGMSRRAVYYFRDRDDEFRAKWDKKLEDLEQDFEEINLKGDNILRRKQYQKALTPVKDENGNIIKDTAMSDRDILALAKEIREANKEDTVFQLGNSSFVITSTDMTTKKGKKELKKRAKKEKKARGKR